MRFALIFAFVSSVFFHTDPADARPSDEPTAQARKPSKAQKRRAARKAKLARQGTKSTRKAKKAAKIEVADKAQIEVDEDEAPDPAPKVEARPAVKRGAVPQA